MPYFKTQELIDLFPDVYAADDAESLLYGLLDAFGAELVAADGKVKALLKSHWVNHASGDALDGLGAIYGVGRRVLSDGKPEPDAQFRFRLKAVVPLFTGGGTVEAVRGAVRSALGLPFDLAALNLPAEYGPLLEDIKQLVDVAEFSPSAERLVDDRVVERMVRDEAHNTDDPDEEVPVGELMLTVETPTVVRGRPQARPRVRWTFRHGGGRRLSIRRKDTGKGIRSLDELVVPRGEPLLLSSAADGRLSAVLGNRDVSARFTNLDGTVPAMLPEIPGSRSEWEFRAQGGVFDVASFGEEEASDEDDVFDLPEYEVEMGWVRYEPLTFDVRVPYFLHDSVKALVDRHKYPGDIFVFKGLPLESIQEVVDQTRAAGVRGNVYFTLNFFEAHDLREGMCATLALHRAREDQRSSDSLTVGSFNRESENHDMGEAFTLGGVWDVSGFDGSFGFE